MMETRWMKLDFRSLEVGQLLLPFSVLCVCCCGPELLHIHVIDFQNIKSCGFAFKYSSCNSADAHNAELGRKTMND